MKKEYIPEGFRKVGTIMRTDFHQKIKELSQAYGGAPEYKVLERGLRDLKPVKPRDLPD